MTLPTRQDLDAFIASAQGASMSPTVEDGDQLEVVRDGVEVGDLAVFVGHKHMVAHRVVACDGEYVWTRGDNLAGPPEQVPLRGVWGKVTSVHRRRGGTVDLSSPRQQLWRAAWNLAPGITRLLGRCASLPRRVLLRASLLSTAPRA